MGIWFARMARATTTSDVFNAIAEPRRREIIDLLAGGRDLAVGHLVHHLGIPQPAVSKHLSVLRQVGVLSMTKRGQQRLYRLNARKLKPVHDWTKNFERYWTAQTDRIKDRAERMARERAAAARHKKEK